MSCAEELTASKRFFACEGAGAIGPDRLSRTRFGGHLGQPDGCDRYRFASRPHRRGRPRLRARRRLCMQSAAPARRQSRFRQDDHCASVFDGRRRRGRGWRLCELGRDRAGVFTPGRARTAGCWTIRSRSSNWVSPESVLDPEQQQSLLYSSDLELGETTKRISKRSSASSHSAS